MARIFLADEEDPAVVLRALLDLAEPNPRVVVWVPEYRAVDVPDELADVYQGVADTADDDVTDADVDALRLRLEELGGKVDGRWGAERLKTEIAALEALKE